MTIEFECVCGETLEAVDEYAGKTGICPVCQRAILIPEITGTPKTSNDSQEIGKKSKQKKWHEERFREEALNGAGEPKEDESAVEDDREGREGESQGQKRGWLWSPKLLGLAGAVVFLTVTILVFTVGKQNEDALEGVVILEEATSPVEKHEDTLVPPVGADLRVETSQVEETPSTEDFVTGGESTEEVVAEVARIKEEAKEKFASFEEKSESIEKPAPLVGSYTINVASFRQKEGADQLVNELKKKGFEAFRWEIDLPQKGRWHRVSIGSFPTRKDANDFVTQKKLRSDFEIFVTQIPDS